MIGFSDLTERLRKITKRYDFSWKDIKEKINNSSDGFKVLLQVINDKFSKQSIPVSPQQAYQNLLFIKQIYNEYKGKLFTNFSIDLPSKLLIKNYKNKNQKIIVGQVFDSKAYSSSANLLNKRVKDYYNKNITYKVCERFSFDADANSVAHEDNHIIHGDLTKSSILLKKRKKMKNVIY